MNRSKLGKAQLKRLRRKQNLQHRQKLKNDREREELPVPVPVEESEEGIFDRFKRAITDKTKDFRNPEKREAVRPVDQVFSPLANTTMTEKKFLEVCHEMGLRKMSDCAFIQERYDIKLEKKEEGNG